MRAASDPLTNPPEQPPEPRDDLAHEGSSESGKISIDGGSEWRSNVESD